MPGLTLREKLLYAAGSFGVNVLSGLFMLWVPFRYGALFTDERKALVGIALFAARLIDAPLDPLVGWWSDRTRSRVGRRRPFIAYGTVPLVMAFALVWAAPGGVDSAWNLAWLLVSGAAFLVLFSTVVNPYLAMLPDIARSRDDRVTLSALIAGVGLAAYALAVIGGSALAGRTRSFAVLVAAACVLVAVSFILPLFVRERTSAEDVAGSDLGLVEAVRRTLANRPFRVFLVSKCLFWVAVHSVVAVTPFFVQDVLGVKGKAEVETHTALLLACAAGPAFVWFAVMKPLARRFSKRNLSLSGLAVLAASAGLLATVGVWPIERTAWAGVLMVLGSYAVAVIYSMPNAILADVVDLDERLTGIRREAIYFGAQGLFVKVAWSGSALLVMAAQGLFHNDPALAVRVSWLAVALISGLAFLVFLRFPGDEELRRMGAESAPQGSGTEG